MLAVLLVGPGDSIQDAIDAAAPGDVVAVTPGVYNEQLTIDKQLTLRGLSANPNDVVIAPGAGDFGDGITVEFGTPSVVIESLRVTGWSENGIFADNVGRTAIHNVVADFNDDDGIDIDGGIRAFVTYVRANDNGDDGMDADGVNGALHVRFSRFNGNGENGVEVVDVDGLVRLLNVTAMRNFDDGVDVRGFGVNGQTDVTILGGRFSSNGVLSNGQFGTTTADGVCLRGIGSLSVTGMLGAGNRDDGLSVAGVLGDVTVLTSIFQGNGLANGQPDGHGIDLNEVAGLITLQFIRANGNFNDGLSIFDSNDVEISASEFLRNGQFGTTTADGVCLRRIGSLSVTDVLAAGNRDDGLSVTGVLGDVTVLTSIFQGNGLANGQPDGHGIELNEVAGLITLQFIRANGNFNDGLSIFDSNDVEISASEFLRNGDDGVMLVDVGDVHAQKIRSSNNGGDGLDVDGGGDITLIASLFNYNGDDGLDLDGIDSLVRIGVISFGNGNFDFEPLDQNF